MTLVPFAIVMIRLWSISWLLGAIEDITYLVEYIHNIMTARSTIYIHNLEVTVGMLLLRMLFDTIVGVAMLAYARPLARQLLRGLTEPPSTQPSAEVWPPPPMIPDNPAP